MRYTKAMKIEQAKFFKEMHKLFTQKGAKDNPSTELYKMVFPNTKVGPYHITIYPGESESELGWIAGCFEDVNKAVSLLGSSLSDSHPVNKFSGKWNHHFFHNKFSQYAIEDAVRYMEFQLEKISL